jgi:hypothetical protein
MISSFHPVNNVADNVLKFPSDRRELVARVQIKEGISAQDRVDRPDA